MCNIHEKSSGFLSIVIGFSLALTDNLSKDIVILEDETCLQEKHTILNKINENKVFLTITIFNFIIFYFTIIL